MYFACLYYFCISLSDVIVSLLTKSQYIFTGRARGGAGAVALRPDVNRCNLQGYSEGGQGISDRVPSRTLHSTTTMSLLELPSLLWTWYIEYLWDYQPGSWVDTSASTFRFFAAFIIMPLALLVMFASPSLPYPSPPQPENANVISPSPHSSGLAFRFVTLVHACVPGS